MQRPDMRRLNGVGSVLAMAVLLLGLWGCQTKGPVAVPAGQPWSEWAPGQVLDAKTGHVVPTGQWLEQLTGYDAIARLRSIDGHVQNAAVERLHIHRHLVAFDGEQHLSRFDGFPRLFQPGGECSFLHRPAKTGHCDGDGHGYSFTRSRMAAVMTSTEGVTAASSGGL